MALTFKPMGQPFNWQNFVPSLSHSSYRCIILHNRILSEKRRRVLYTGALMVCYSSLFSSEESLYCGMSSNASCAVLISRHLPGWVYARGQQRRKSIASTTHQQSMAHWTREVLMSGNRSIVFANWIKQFNAAALSRSNLGGCVRRSAS